MICGACSAVVFKDLTPVRGLVSCPACLRTVVLATGALATGAETLGLSDEELKALKNQRKAARKARAV